MKDVIKGRFLLLIILVMALAFTGVTAMAEGQEYIRLHVIASSDGDYDQAIKLVARDAILECATKLLEDCQSSDQAYSILYAGRDELLAAAEAELMGEGFDGAVEIQMGTFEFPDRVYGDTLVPAGEYRAVRVILGEGEGRNWWCVIYPGMCLPEEADEGEVVFYSSIVRWFTQAFGGAS